MTTALYYFNKAYGACATASSILEEYNRNQQGVNLGKLSIQVTACVLETTDIASSLINNSRDIAKKARGALIVVDPVKKIVEGKSLSEVATTVAYRVSDFMALQTPQNTNS